MKIQITEINSNEVPYFAVQGESLFIDDVEVDFSVLQPGDDIVPNEQTPKHILGGGRALDGTITINLSFPYNRHTFKAGHTIAHEVEVTDGVIDPYIEVTNV